MRRRLSWAVPALALAFTLAVAASSASAQSPATARLMITVWPNGSGASYQRQVICPSRAKACAALGRLGPRAFAPVPAGTMCSQIYSGPQRAHVVGVLDGRRVDARLDLRDGCQTARWLRLADVVPVPAHRR